MEYDSDLRSRTALGLYSLKGRTPYKVVPGETPDISEWMEFTFYQPIWYHTPNVYPEPKRILGRWIGVSH
jgi:hypothetical protein